MKFTKFVLTLAALLLVPLAASAGGWALTTIEDMPGGFEAGETYELSYTILQHGRTPVDVGASSVFVTDSAGQTTEFQATRSGEVGRYTVEVTFPDSGTFTWQVNQGGFAPHDLGAIEVSGQAVTSTGSAGTYLLPIALALVIGLLGLQVFSLIRKRPRTVDAD